MSKTLQEKLGKEKLKELLKEVEGEDKDMLAVIEMIREENRMIRDAGRKAGIIAGREEGRKEIISNMLKNGMKEEEIIKITGISKKELEQVKKKIEK